MNPLACTTVVRHLILKLWLCVFTYAMLAGSALQLVMLPFVFPSLHAGDGLLAGRDWVGFHKQAVEMAQKIEQGGWVEFMLRPDGDNAITGVMSFFYALFGHYPWTLLPLNAALFATGACALFALLKCLDLDDKEAVIALLPYALFPSAALQYGQIHKDIFCTASSLVILWSWVALLDADRKFWKIFPLILASALALAIVWVFRPYLMVVFQAFGALLLLWLLGSLVWQLVLIQKKRNHTYQANLTSALYSVAILMILNAFVYWLSVSYLDVKFSQVTNKDSSVRVVYPVFIFSSNKHVRSRGTERIFLDDKPSKESSIDPCQYILVMKDNTFFKNMINHAFLKIAVSRDGFISSGGETVASNIDADVSFCKNEDVIRYIPRAMQIGSFAPFPSSWFAVERRNSSAVEIYISAAEMALFYVLCLGLLYWLVSYRRWGLALIAPIVLALGMILLLGLTVANVGTLYRMRFPYAMVLASFGVAGIFQFVKIKRQMLTSLNSTGH